MWEEIGHAAEYSFVVQIATEGQSTFGQSTLYDQVYRLFRKDSARWLGIEGALKVSLFNGVTCLKPAKTKMIPRQLSHSPTRPIA